MNSKILIRVWYEDGYYEERTFSSDNGDIQWSRDQCDKHGKIETIIIDTEW